jgi:hypothetical protein
MATTQEERKRIIDEARALVIGKLDADNGLAAWSTGRKARQEPEPEGGAAMAAPEPPPAPVAANPDPGGWNAWAQAEQSQLSPFMTQLLGDLIAHERHEFDKALARERRQFELALAKLRTELCTHITDTLGRIERVICAERIVRDERAAGAGPTDKALN